MPSTIHAETKSMGIASINTNKNGNILAESLQMQSVNFSPKPSKFDILGMKIQMRNTVDMIQIWYFAFIFLMSPSSAILLSLSFRLIATLPRQKSPNMTTESIKTIKSVIFPPVSLHP